MFQIDHIIPIRHGGSALLDNLCLACADCNQYKGPEVAMIDPQTGVATRLFNPRQQAWNNHFRLNSDGSLSGKTPEGRATVRVLRMNEEERVEQRHGEMLLGNYPCSKNP
ncbi:MAG: HNH endonuclease [Chloroflexota bacterium]|nr:HNH endonuclease [Chloroflexota bacterium]